MKREKILMLGLRPQTLASSSRASRLLSLITAVGVAVTAAPPASAQDEQPGLQEIIVTSQKRQQRLKDVPAIVNVLQAETLAAAHVTELNQLSTFTPGIVINSDQTGRNTDIKIRGIGNEEGSNLRPSIGFFYNDIPVLNQKQGGQSVASDIDFGDISRIEVLKGPQSTLFGESVSGGAIALYSKRPATDDDFDGHASVTVGDLDRVEARAALGVSWNEMLAARVSVYKTTVDDQVVNTLTNAPRTLRSDGFSLQLLARPNDDLKFILEYNRRETQSHGGANDGEDVLSYGPQTIADARTAGVQLTPADPYDRKIQAVDPLQEVMVDDLTSLHATWNINDQWNLVSISAYQTNRDKFYGDGLLGGYNVSGTIVPGFWAFGHQHIDYTTQEVRLNYNSEHLNSLFGVFYSNYRAPLSRDDLGIVYPGFIFPLLTYQTDNNNEWSVFLHNSIKFDDWELVVGARYTEEVAEGYSELAYSQGAYSGFPFDGSSFRLRHSQENAWGGTIKLIRKLSESVSVYAGVDRGFRLGGINTLGAPNYATEVAYNYEAGLKGTFFDNTVRVDAALFLTDYDGYQAAVYDSASFNFITQNADVRAEGGEIEAAWTPVRHLTLNANAAYTYAKFKRYPGAPCDNYQNAFGFCPNSPAPGVQDLSGTELSQSPRWSTNLAVQYDGDFAALPLQWFARGEMAYRGSAYAHAVGINGDPLQLMPSYVLFNASVGLADPARGWKANIWVKNLTNENYLTQVVRQPAGSDPNYVLARIGMERTFGVTLSYDF